MENNHEPELLIYYAILSSIFLIAMLCLAIGLLRNYLGMIKENKKFRKQ